MLLVLDNFEHLLDGADLVATMLTQAPHLLILVTSRERLHLQAEWLFDVSGLAYPQQDQYGVALLQRQNEPSAYSAVQLFLQRAIQVKPTLVLDDAGMLAITRICQHVAGMPLAIELAAAGAHTLPLVEIEQQIRTNIDALETTLRDVPPRHRSLRAVFDHSWKLLDEHERALFSRLAVFRGGWSAPAAAEVAGATRRMLAALADASLVRQSSLTDTTNQEVPESRWSMLESLREYALEHLEARHELAAIQHAHARYLWRWPSRSPYNGVPQPLNTQSPKSGASTITYALHSLGHATAVTYLDSNLPRRCGNFGAVMAISTKGEHGLNNCLGSKQRRTIKARWKCGIAQCMQQHG